MENDKALAVEDGKVIRREYPLAGVRKIIAHRMVESLQKSPQATMTTKADMSALISLKETNAKQGLKLTYTDLFIKVAAVALKLNPALNSSLQNGRIKEYESINIGVAVGTEKGLFVPVIKNIQDKGLAEISQELKGFIQRINEGRINGDDFTGGTFTISNLGMYGIDMMTPIINAPEAAILCTGATRRELVAGDDDTVKIKPMITLSLTLDHAVMDGLHGAKFMETFRKVMENPDF